MSETARVEHVQIVTQRMSRARLLVSEKDDSWIETGPGLVWFVSFISEQYNDGDEGPIAPLEERMSKVVKGLMTAKLATSSGWKSDHSDAESIANLIASTDPVGECVSILVVPQATLAGKLKTGDKYLKYHRQVSRERGWELYCKLLVEIEKFVNPQSPSSITEGVVRDHSVREIFTHKNPHSKLKLAWGTYGGRQGLELTSTGPSTHFFQY